jgi:hypothetical protein
MNLGRFQQQIVPTIGLLNSSEVDSQLVMHKDCIPYKPFTRKALEQAIATTCKPLKPSDLLDKPPAIDPLQVIAEAVKRQAAKRKRRL